METEQQVIGVVLAMLVEKGMLSGKSTTLEMFVTA